MKDVLFIHSCDIDNPKRGTPIRIRAILDQIKAEPELRVHVYNGTGKTTLEKFRDLRHRPEGIFFGNTHQDLWILVLSKIILRKKIAIDIHGAWEEEMYASGQITRLKKYALRMIFLNAFRFFDVLSLVNSVVQNMVRPYTSRTVVTYPGIDAASIPSAFDLPPRSNDAPYRIGYVGNARGYQGADSTLRIARRLRNEGLPFVLSIISSEEATMRQLILQEYGEPDERMEIQYELDHEDALRATAACDILLILRPKNPVTDLSFPSKLAEYLATGRTTIVTSFADVPQLIKNGTDAYIISADHREEEAYALLRDMILRKQPLLDPLAVRERCLERFSWHAVTRQLIQAVCKL